MGVTTFFILTPLYIYLSATSKITNFLDDRYYLLEICFIIILIIKYRINFSSFIEKIWLVIFLYFSIILLYDLFYMGGDYLKSFRNLLLTSFLYFLLGKNLCKVNIFFLIILMLLVLISNFDMNDGRISFEGALEENRYNSYLEISHKLIIGVLLTNFLLARDESSIKNFMAPLLIMFISLMIGARSDLVISIYILLILAINNKKIANLKIIIILLIVPLMLFFLFIIKADSRLLNIFDIRSDDSYIGRKNLFFNGLSNIYDNPIFGDYTIAGDQHIHNFLFFWQKYGLLPFLLVSFIILYIVIYKINIKNIKNCYIHSYSVISIYIILSILIFKDGYFEYISLLCGLSGNRFLRKNE